MSCNPELVSAFLDGELESIILEPVTRHLLVCDDCCRTMGMMAQVRSALADGFALCDPESVTRSVMMAISNERIESPREGLRRRLLRFGVPAVVIAGALSAWPVDAVEGVADAAAVECPGVPDRVA